MSMLYYLNNIVNVDANHVVKFYRHFANYINMLF